MKKPTFVQVEIPPGYKVKEPLEIFTKSDNKSFVQIVINIQKKVSTITKDLIK